MMFLMLTLRFLNYNKFIFHPGRAQRHDRRLRRLDNTKGGNFFFKLFFFLNQKINLINPEFFQFIFLFFIS
jgi:hypothetical protein